MNYVAENDIIYNKACELIAKGQSEEAFSLANSESLEIKLQKRLLLRAMIHTVPLGDYFDKNEDDGSGPTPISKREYSKLDEMLRDGILEYEQYLSYGHRKGMESFSAELMGCVEERFLRDLDVYIGSIIDPETMNDFYQYHRGYTCLSYKVLISLIMLAKRLGVKDFSSASRLNEMNVLVSKKLANQVTSVIVPRTESLAVDYPYFTIDEAREVSPLFILSAHMLKQAIGYQENSQNCDQNLVVLCKKELIAVNINYLNSLIVSGGSRTPLVRSKEKRDALYKEILDMTADIQKVEPNYVCPKYTEKSSKGCYVATAVYGSYDCPQVWTLRRFRDSILSKHMMGRCFIRLYYTISPTLVKFFGKTGWFQRFWRKHLDKLVAILQRKGISSTPYQD